MLCNGTDFHWEGTIAREKMLGLPTTLQLDLPVRREGWSVGGEEWGGRGEG